MHTHRQPISADDRIEQLEHALRWVSQDLAHTASQLDRGRYDKTAVLAALRNLITYIAHELN